VRQFVQNGGCPANRLFLFRNFGKGAFHTLLQARALRLRQIGHRFKLAFELLQDVAILNDDRRVDVLEHALVPRELHRRSGSDRNGPSAFGLCFGQVGFRCGQIRGKLFIAAFLDCLLQAGQAFLVVFEDRQTHGDLHDVFAFDHSVRAAQDAFAFEELQSQIGR
jgi:hypothetical protein